MEPALDQLITAYLSGILEAYSEDPELERKEVSFNMALAALFDLCVNALYARDAAAADWLYCRDKADDLENSHFRGDYLYYPFVSACPRCSVTGRFYKAEAKKPQSGSIGDANSIVVAAMYARVADAAPGAARVLRVPGTGDVDLVFVEDEDICLAEIKASPLVSYPLAVGTDPLDEFDPDSGSRASVDHRSFAATRLSAEPVYLYMPHVGEYIDLGPKVGETWPMDSLIDFVSSSQGASAVACAWARLFEIYSDKDRRKSDGAWWLVNGCGKPGKTLGGNFTISDGKNMPGIDRTDDLKKGTYQLLKMGAVHKERRDRKVRTALVANVHAVVHDEVYVTNLADIVWTKDGEDDAFVIEKTENEWTVSKEGVFNLFDGVVCITSSRFRDPWLETIADVNSLR